MHTCRAATATRRTAPISITPTCCRASSRWTSGISTSRSRGEPDRERVLRIIREHLRRTIGYSLAWLRRSILASRPLRRVRDRVLEAARFIPVEPVGNHRPTAGFAPFNDAAHRPRARRRSRRSAPESQVRSGPGELGARLMGTRGARGTRAAGSPYSRTPRSILSCAAAR